MTSFISSFNRIRIFTIFAALAITALIAYRYPHNMEAEVDYEPEFSNRISEELREKEPDLVLLGNSLLYKNVDETLLADHLQEKLGRPVRTVFITQAGAYSAWAFLVIKNQIIQPGIKPFKVGYFFRADHLTSPLLDFENKTTLHIERQLKKDEPLFMSKVDSIAARISLYIHSQSWRKSLSVSILKDWIRIFTLGKKFNPSSLDLLKERFNLTNRDPQKNVGLIKNPAASTKRNCGSFEECLPRSFLPEMISLLGKDRLFFVRIHEKPPIEKSGETTNYERRLREYLGRKGVKLVDLSEKEELNNPSLYWRKVYLTEEGRAINTAILADEIIRAWGSSIISGKANPRGSPGRS